MNEPAPRDVVIAGGGLAGGLAALALARLGLTVTLVEAQAPSARGGKDGRSISLSLATLRVLDALGIAEALAAVSQPITTVHIGRLRTGTGGARRVPAGRHHGSRARCGCAAFKSGHSEGGTAGG